MISISLCMIVKNEERVLKRCLESIADLVDEIIVIDTGSTDSTKSIALEYTDKIYDFEWIDDFSAARNFSFSKASCDYIYIADADEYLDADARDEFKKLKECMLPEIEIVQMHYNTVGFDTVLNIKSEYRPKLFKRLREFTWIDPIHETVRLDPVVFDSDIVITHAPENMHSARDFGIFKRTIARDGFLSNRVARMYAIELLKNGSLQDLQDAEGYFTDIHDATPDSEMGRIAACVLARLYRVSGNTIALMKYALSDAISGFSSEVCLDVAQMFFEAGACADAFTWASNAHLKTESVIDVHSSGDAALIVMINSLSQIAGEDENALALLKDLELELDAWEMPEEFDY